MSDVIPALLEALQMGREVVHCLVVETRGSTPQKAGARMLVFGDGRQAGTLGGGCVENEVRQKAMRLFGRAEASLSSFVLDHDYAWADGLICGGKMVILSESFAGESAIRYVEALDALYASGLGHTEAVVVEPERTGLPLGARALFDDRGILCATLGGAGTARPADPEPLEARPGPSARQGVAYLPTLPRVRLVIVGAGHVGQAVADLASRCDFDVWVVDDRAQYANAERFPFAQKLLVGPIEDVLRDLDVTSQTYALIVTRGHGHDQEALYHLAPTPAPYVGLIGSKRKIRMIFEALREQGIGEEALARVKAPVGFDVGSQTVPEIAVSIVAELIARRNRGAIGR